MSMSRYSDNGIRTRREKYMVDPAKKYREIQRSINNQFLYDVAGIVLEHRGLEKAITREDLSMRLFGRFTETTDRKVRLAIKKLFKEFGIPIGAISKQAGYFIICNSRERDMVKDDHESRRNEENEMIRLLDNIDLDEEPEMLVQAEQIGLPL